MNAKTQQNMKKCIVFTGGGTAGHVTPNIALIKQLQKDDHINIHYVGSNDGIEKQLIRPLQIDFHGIRSGKLRRYFSWKNFIDPFNIGIGILQSLILLHKLKPNLVFSKGGFVAFPVVFAAWLLRIPVIAHESDMTPGLANKLSFPFAQKICLSFEKTQQYFKNKSKTIITGTPIRAELFQGDKNKGLEYCQFTTTKPCLLIIGGSMGSEIINQTIRAALNTLLKHYQVIHICGKNKLDASLKNQVGYKQFEYIQAELPDLFAASDIVISRSGANSLFELLALQKLHVLIPLSLKASRGDQIHNARYFEKKGTSVVLAEEDLTPDSLYQALQTVQDKANDIRNELTNQNLTSGTDLILQIIKKIGGASN